jgi:hypothetical protein
MQPLLVFKRLWVGASWHWGCFFFNCYPLENCVETMNTNEVFMHHPDQPRAPQKRINDWICFHLELVIGFAMVTIFLASPSAWGLTVSPAAVSFQAVQGSTNPPSQAISLSKSNKRQTTWAATDNAAWLSVSPGTGPLANTAQITIAVNATGLPVGSYSATVTIKTDKAGSASVPVTLTVAPAPASLSPTRHRLPGAPLRAQI